MRLGLLSDIHEEVEPLAAAVRELRARHADSFVILGDIVDRGERLEETVALLRDLPTAIGVWGNHDLGLCGEVHPAVREQFSPSIVDYFARLRPSGSVDGVHFQHVDPHLDPESMEDLWRFTTEEERIVGLAGCSHSRIFMGHLHGWGMFTPAGRVPWQGEGPFRYDNDQRYLTVVHAVCDGWCAMLDTGGDVLEPIRVAWSRPAPP